MPWILCGPGRPPEITGEAAGSTPITCSFGLRSFRKRPAPVIVPPVPTPATSTSMSPSSVSHSSGPGAAVVRVRVGGVGELVGEPERVVARERLRGGDRLVHAAERLRDLELRAVEPQQPLALAAHALREREDQVVALGRADEGQRDAGVAARRLDDRGAPGLDPALGLGGLDHRDPDAVLDGAAGVEHLELGEQRCRRVRQQAGQLHHRRAADPVSNVDRDRGHSCGQVIGRLPGQREWWTTFACCGVS